MSVSTLTHMLYVMSAPSCHNFNLPSKSGSKRRCGDSSSTTIPSLVWTACFIHQHVFQDSYYKHSIMHVQVSQLFVPTFFKSPSNQTLDLEQAGHVYIEFPCLFIVKTCILCISVSFHTDYCVLVCRQFVSSVFISSAFWGTS